MGETFRRWMCGSLAMLLWTPLHAAEDMLQFYEEEAKVVSASRQPQPMDQAPATVYVVTQQDIRASGAKTLWDALRGVPGVDVMQTRTAAGEVSIRGLNRPINNRVLVLLDGRTVLNGYFDTVTWEAIPVQLDEIDRIEVVEGPASAVYGANAILGVINIITKTPEQLGGGRLSYTTGERNTQLGSFVYGRKMERSGFKLSSGWRATNRFEDASRPASEAGQFSGLWNRDFSERSSLSLSGGFTRSETQITLGGLGTMIDAGYTSFARTDYRYGKTRLRGFWNGGRTHPRENVVSEDDDLDYDTYDATLEQAISLPWKNEAVVGAGYRRNEARSSILGSGEVHQDLWSAFFEDRWEMGQKWLMMASGRFDRHPLTPVRFSPRGSLLYTPVTAHVFRASAGTSFRNPTLVENYFDSTVVTPNPGSPGLPNPPISEIHARLLGYQDLMPETVESAEIAHNAKFNRVKTAATGFRHRYKRAIQPVVGQAVPAPPVLTIPSTFENSSDSLTTWGYQLDAVVFAAPWLRLFGNYSYQYLKVDNDASPDAYIARQSPRHKANWGARAQTGGFTTQWMVHWVDKTEWGGIDPVNSYFLVNAGAFYAFGGRFKGLELGVSAFNLLNHDHYEIAPTSDGGEIIRSRLLGTVSYKF